MLDYISKTFFKGLKLVVPLILIIYLFQNIYSLMIDFLNPIITALPEIHYFGHEFLDLRAFVTLLVVTFLVGLLIRAGFGIYLFGFIADLLNKIFPGSALFDQMIKEKSEANTGEYKNVAMMFLDDGWVIGIIIEEKNDEGFVMLYVPSAPIPTSGTLYMMPEDKIKRVNIPIHKALTSNWQLGKNADKILKGKIDL